MKVKQIAIISFFALVIAFPAFAQFSLPGPVPDRTDTRTRDTEELRREMSDEAERREQDRDLMMNRDGRFRGHLEEKREQFQFRHDEFREEMRERRAEARNLRSQRRADLRERLQDNVNDERKRRIVERVHERMGELNERMTGHFADLLDKLEDILERIVSRTDKFEERGLDVSEARQAIADAEEAISAARDEAARQAGAVYEIPVTDEDGLRTDVGSARQELHSDLIAVREIVRQAFRAVQNAATTLAQVERGNTDEENNEQTIDDELTEDENE